MQLKTALNHPLKPVISKAQIHKFGLIKPDKKLVDFLYWVNIRLIYKNYLASFEVYIHIYIYIHTYIHIHFVGILQIFLVVRIFKCENCSLIFPKTKTYTYVECLNDNFYYPHHMAAYFLFNPFDPVGTINLPSPIFWQAFHCANFPLRRLLVMRPLNPTLSKKISKFPIYNTKCREKLDTIRKTPRSISFSPLNFV